MSRNFTVVLFVAALAAPTLLSAQTGGFVVRLGNDTISVERFQRTGTRVDGTVVRHAPQVTLVRYRIDFDPDGGVGAYEQSTLRADGTPVPNAPMPFRMRFTSDTVVREMVQNGQPVTLRSPAPRGTLPAIPGSYLSYEMVLQAARSGRLVGTMGFGPRQTEPAMPEVQLVGSDSAEIILREPGYGPGGGELVLRTGFRSDARGQLIRSDGALTTTKYRVERVTDVDVAAIASAWSDLDAAGRSMGVASPRDTLVAGVSGATIRIDYSRPAQRGREIWGALVPYGEVWRLGANAATQLTTDRDLDIGGFTVPAGTYTLWLLPTKTETWLIVNKQTGQWGTSYDQAQDLVRIPVQPHMNLATAEERFHIFVAGDLLMMHWGNGGYGVRVSVK